MLHHLPIFTTYQNIHKIANTNLEKKSRIEFNEKNLLRKKRKKRNRETTFLFIDWERDIERKKREYKFNPTLFDDARNTKSFGIRNTGTIRVIELELRDVFKCNERQTEKLLFNSSLIWIIAFIYNSINNPYNKRNFCLSKRKLNGIFRILRTRIHVCINTLERDVKETSVEVERLRLDEYWNRQ